MHKLFILLTAKDKILDRFALSGGKVLVLVFFCVLCVGVSLGNSFLSSGGEKSMNSEKRGVLADVKVNPDLIFGVNSDSIFRGEVELLASVSARSTLTVDELSTLGGGVVTNDADVDAGEGNVFASNLLYGVVAGTGISIGEGQTPTITNTGVTSFQGSTGVVSLTAGSGISISGTTISSTVSAPSASNSFANIAVSGEDTLTAGSSTDTLTIVEGTGVVLTTDSTNKTLTIDVVGGVSSQWTTAGSDIYYSLGNVGIGTSTPATALDVSGTVTVTGLSIGGDTFSELVGTGLQLNGSTLETVLGTSIDLTTEVTGVLPVLNGGTGATTLADLITLGTMTTGNYVATVTGNSQISVGGSGSENAGVTLSIAGDSIGDSQLAFDTGQNLTTLSSPTFAGLTLTSLLMNGDTITDFTGTGLQVVGNALQTTLGTTIDLTTEVSGILPLVNGGTNKNLTAVAGGVVYSDADSFEILAAGNSGQVLQSGGAGAPVWVDASTVGLNYWQVNSGSLAPLTTSNALVLGGNTTTSHFLEVNGTKTGKALAVLNETGGQDIFTASASGTTRFVITNGGNLGIGTTTPNAQLSVTRPLSFGATGKALAIFNQIENQDIFTASASGTTRLTLTNGGNLLPGTNDAQVLGSNTLRWQDLYLGPDSIHIGTSTSDEYTIGYNTANNYLGFNVNGSGNPEVVFDSNGNVGIGTTGTLARLDIKDSASLATEGSEKITADDNRTFETDTGSWTTSGGPAWKIDIDDSNRAVKDAPGTGELVLNNAALDSPANVLDGVYQVTFSYTTAATSSGSLTPRIGGANGKAIGQLAGDSETQSQVMIYAGGFDELTFIPTENWYGSIDDISVKRLSTSSIAMRVENSDGAADPIEIRSGGSGLSNIFIGDNAGQVNISGTYNTALGSSVLSSNTTGTSNTAVGNLALAANTTGVNNTAAGSRSLTANITGNNNTAFGLGGLFSNTIGDNNIALGSTALWSNTVGSDNVALGTGTLWSITSGSQNVAVGNEAGFNNVSGSGNVFLGHRAGYNETGGQKLYIDNSSTSSPLIWGDFNTDVVNFNGNVGIGRTDPEAKLSILGDFTDSTDIGAAIRGENSGSYLSLIQTAVWAWGIGMDQSSTSLNFVADMYPGHSGSTKMTLDQNGNLGIGVTNPNTFKLEVAGSIGPSVDDTYDLGSNTRRFKDLYLGPDTLHIGTSTSDEYTIGYDTTNNRLGFNVNGSGDPEIVMNSSGNLGIGTTTPVLKMEVAGSAQVTNTGFLQFGTDSGRNIEVKGSSATAYIDLADTSADYDTRLLSDTSNNFQIYVNGSGTPAMHISSGGNVGIGTTTPTNQLSVTRSLSLGVTGKALAIFDQIENQDIFTASASGTNRFVIKNGGNVGIGTALPGEKLTVSGGDIAARSTGSSETRLVGAFSSDFDSTFQSIYMIYRDSAAASTSLGISNADHASLVFQNTTTASIYTNGQTPLIFGTFGSENMRIASGGNVGIGTTAPNAKLHLVSSQTATNTTLYGSYFDHAVSGTLTGDATEYSLAVNTSVSGLDHMFFHRTSGIRTDVALASNSTTDYLLGIDSSVAINSTRLTTAGYTATSSAAFSGNIQLNSAGRVRNMYGAVLSSTTTTGTVDNNYGIAVDAQLSGGTITSNYGGRFTATGGTTAYGIYVNVNSASTNYAAIFTGGVIGVGVTNPTASGIQIERPGTGLRLHDSNGTNGEFWNVGAADGASNNFVVYNQSGTGVYVTDGGTAWNANSDERLKKDIHILGDESGLAAIRKLNPVTYHWKDVRTPGERLGFIAQNVQEVFPQLVSTGSTKTILLEDGSEATIVDPLGLDYSGFVVPLIKGVQELDQKLALQELRLSEPQQTSNTSNLQAQIDTLTSQMASMSAGFATLESLVQQAGETSNLLEQLLNSPLLSASGSGVLGADASVETLVVGDSLQVLGHTTLSDLGVTGNITAGVLSINGLEGSINTVGEPLKLQNLGVEGIDILDGKVTIDTSGNITSEGEITVKKVNIDETEVAGKSIGGVTIPAGELYIDVPTAALTTKSRIFVSPERPAAVGGRRLNTSELRIELETALEDDLKVNWWVVN